MDYKDKGVDTLKIFANSAGDFKGMKQEFDNTLNQVNYPIFAEDRQGFRFENNAFKNVAESR